MGDSGQLSVRQCTGKTPHCRKLLESTPEYKRNVEALKSVQPKRLEASEIEVRLGSMWIPLEVYEQFMIETFQPPKYIAANHTIKIQYSSYTGEWNIQGKI